MTTPWIQRATVEGVSGQGSYVLLVDVGGVLFAFDDAHRVDRLGELFGRSAQQVKEALWDSGFSADADAGRYPTAAEVRAQVRTIMGYCGPDEDLDIAWCSAFKPAEDVISLVGQTAVPRGVFTNNGPLEEEVLTRLYPEVFALFDHLFFCHRMSANKPDPAFMTRFRRSWPYCRPGSGSQTMAKKMSMRPAVRGGRLSYTARPRTWRHSRAGNQLRTIRPPERWGRGTARHAYRTRLRAHHPDTRPTPSPRTADEHLRQVLAAYALLRDPARRADYDHATTHAAKPPDSTELTPPDHPPARRVQIPITHRTTNIPTAHVSTPPLRAGPVRRHR